MIYSILKHDLPAVACKTIFLLSINRQIHLCSTDRQRTTLMQVKHIFVLSRLYAFLYTSLSFELLELGMRERKIPNLLYSKV